MPLNISYCKLLALRAHNTPERNPEECLPSQIMIGEVYPFDKSEQRAFDIQSQIPLHETKGNEKLGRPLALVKIIELTHYVKDGKVRTKGKYKIERIINTNEILIWNFGSFEIKKVI